MFTMKMKKSILYKSWWVAKFLDRHHVFISCFNYEPFMKKYAIYTAVNVIYRISVSSGACPPSYRPANLSDTLHHPQLSCMKPWVFLCCCGIQFNSPFDHLSSFKWQYERKLLTSTTFTILLVLPILSLQ